MHPTETKNQFIELRAQGWSLARIATHIGVSKRSLIDWNRQCHAEIQQLQALETEALHERILASHEEELRRLAGHLTAIENELARRGPKALNTLELFRMSALIRSQIHDLRTEAARPVPAAARESGAGVPPATAGASRPGSPPPSCE